MPEAIEHIIIREGPHLTSGEGIERVYWTTLVALAPAMAVGAACFGWSAVVIILACALTAFLSEWVFTRLSHQHWAAGASHAVLMGVIFALTLPPTTHLYLGVIGAALAVLVGKCLFGGVGHFLWHPALVARIALQFFFPEELAPKYWPVLANGRLLLGSLDRAEVPTDYSGWWQTPPADNASAWLLRHPLQAVRDLVNGNLAHQYANELTDSPAGAFTCLIRDHLPPLEDLAVGTTGGAIGEVSMIALLVGGIYLIYRGYVDWRLPVGMFLGLIVAAVVCPVRIAVIPDAWPGWRWFPLWGAPADVWISTLGYLLASGGLVLTAFFIAPEPGTRPETRRGQFLFGLGCGVLTLLMRYYGMFPGSAYAAVIIMSTFGPVITRRTRSRPFGL